MDFHNLRTVLLDLDGVMYRGVQLCPGAAELVAFLRQMGVRPFYLSNNSRSGPEVVAKKLSDLGVPTADDEVVTAAELLVEHMAVRPAKGKVTSIASDWVSQQLERAGWQLADSGADCVVVGLDHAFTYAKLRLGVDALLGGAELIAANMDPVNPIEETLEPGCGALVSAFVTATGAEPVCIGKPTLTMLERALQRMDLRPDQAVMVGDSLVSDMVLARRGGTHSVLLLSGQTSRDMADALPPEERPDLVLGDLAALLAAWRGATR